MRINNPIIPLKNVTEVFPSPFNTLVNVVFKYKNGQIQARIVMKFPANELEKTNSPKKFPNIKKKKRLMLLDLEKKKYGDITQI